MRKAAAGPASVKPHQWFYTLLGYLMIALALVVAAVAIAEAFVALLPIADRWQTKLHIPEQTIQNWYGFLFTTPILIWILIKGNKQKLRNRVFRAVLAFLLVCHFLFFRDLFLLIPRWRMVWTLMLMPLESIPMSLALDLATRYLHAHRKRKRATLPDGPQL